MLQLYMHLASSRLACRDIQRIQPIQLYSDTRYTAYSTIQPPSAPHIPEAAVRFVLESMECAEEENALMFRDEHIHLI